MCKIPEDLQYFQLKSLDIDWSVRIKLPSCVIEYQVNKDYGYYLKDYKKSIGNNAIFIALGIDSPQSFVKDIVGYKCDGMFPEVRSKEDLLKVIIALDKECIKKFGDKNKQSEFKDGDYVSIMQNNELLWIIIFKQHSGDKIYRYANYSNNTKNLYLYEYGYIISSSNRIIRYATKEEQEILDDELLKKGLAWDVTCKKLVPVNTIATDSCKTKINISLCQEGMLTKTSNELSQKCIEECIEESKNKTMPIFNVGDVVRIKPRTKDANEYIPIYTTSMAQYAGKIATVVNISPVGSIQLDIDSFAYYWAPEILEKVADDKIVSTADLTINTVQNVKPLTLTELKQTESEKINLFPTKKHYQFNFSIN